MTSPRQQAREAFAEAMLARDKGLGNAAASVRAGFENFWVAPALDAIERVMLLLPDGDDEAEEKGRR